MIFCFRFFMWLFISTSISKCFAFGFQFFMCFHFIARSPVRGSFIFTLFRWWCSVFSIRFPRAYMFVR